MTRQFLVFPLSVALLATAAGAQVEKGSTRPAFTVVSIKPNVSGATGRGAIRLQPGGGFVATNATARQLIEYAFQRHAFDRREVSGGPAWTDTERFDVAATASGEHSIDADGSFREPWAMIRALLEDRFKLKVSEDERQRPVYALVLARSEGTLGPKLQKTVVDCRAVLRGERPATPPAYGPPCSYKNPPGRLFVNTAGMATIASLLSQHVDRVVLDRTGLSGRFDMELEAVTIKAPADYKPGPSDLGLAPATTPSIFVALREQLGLRLEPQTAAVPVIVIERIERPVID